MSRERCPSCGGLVAADLEFCPQCYTRFDRTPARPPGPAAPSEPVPAAPPARPQAPDRPAAAPGLVRSEDGLRWACPTCEMQNQIEAQECVRCGTPFSTLLDEQATVPDVEPGRAVLLSFFFPGLGHRALGKTAEAIARMVVFSWILLMAVAIVLIRRGEGLGPFLPLVLVLGLSAALVYALTAIDAGRLAQGDAPLLTSRILLYGMAMLMLFTVGILLFLGTRASRA